MDDLKFLPDYSQNTALKKQQVSCWHWRPFLKNKHAKIWRFYIEYFTSQWARGCMFHLKLLCFIGFPSGLFVMPHYHFICFNIIVLLSKSAPYSCSRNLSFHFEYIKTISVINIKRKCQVANISSLMLQKLWKQQLCYVTYTHSSQCNINNGILITSIRLLLISMF